VVVDPPASCALVPRWWPYPHPALSCALMPRWPSYPHPALRATFSRQEKEQLPAPLLPGEGLG